MLAITDSNSEDENNVNETNLINRSRNVCNVRAALENQKWSAEIEISFDFHCCHRPLAALKCKVYMRIILNFILITPSFRLEMYLYDFMYGIWKKFEFWYQM